MSATNVIKSPNDKKEYRSFQLPNGVSVLAISDPEMRTSVAEEGKDDPNQVGGDKEEDEEMIDESEGDDDGEESEDGPESESNEDKQPKAVMKKAAAAVTVRVGSFSDPTDANGLAHYLEHMLFMGSEKYPDENAYDAFLSQHGGMSNAFTETEFTTYYFNINFQFLFDALDRLAQFFINPLLRPDGLAREVNAVHSEFSGALQNDSCRLMQLYSATAKPHHVLSHFLWGNELSLKTLPEAKGIDIRAELWRLYSQWYVGPLMCVSVLAAEDLDTIEGRVRESFEKVRPQPGIVAPSFEKEGFPFPSRQIHLLGAIKDVNIVSLTWQLPAMRSCYTSKPEEYAANLLGHEAKGSLLSLFREMGWCSQLVAGVGDDGFNNNSASSLFTISVTLTDEGLSNIIGIVNCVYNYIALMDKATPQQWLFDEQKAIHECSFRFAEETSAEEFVSDISSSMPFVRPEHLLVHNDLFETWRPDLISEVIGLLNPNNMRIDILSKQSFGDLSLLGELRSVFTSPHTEELQEKWFQFPFKRSVLPDELMSQFESSRKTIHSQLSLPERNVFVAENFELVEPQPTTVAQLTNCTADQLTPKLISHSARHQLWYLQDTIFRIPKAVVRIIAFGEELVQTLRGAVLLDLYVKLLADATNHVAYMAHLAGLELSVGVTQTGSLDMSLSGFNDKLSLLVNCLADHLALPQLTEQRIALFSEELTKEYLNAELRPLKHANNLRLHQLKRYNFRSKERLEFLRENANMGAMRSFLTEVLSETSLEIFICGNITESSCVQIGNTVADRFALLTSLVQPNKKAKLNDTLQRLPMAVAQLSLRSAVVVAEPTVNVNEENSAVQVYFQFGHDTVALRTTADLLSELMYEPMFGTLRTKEQLGYVVECGARLTGHVVGFVVSVQSTTFSVRHVLSRISTFLKEFSIQLRTMEPSKFQSFVTAFSQSLQQKDTNLKEFATKHWTHIDDGRYRFTFRQQAVQWLSTVSQLHMADFVDKMLLSHEGGKLCCLSVKPADATATDEDRAQPDGLSLFGALVQADHKASLPDFPFDTNAQ